MEQKKDEIPKVDEASVQIEIKEKPIINSSEILRSPLLSSEQPLKDHYYEGKFTLADNFLYATEKFGPNLMYTFRKVIKEHIVDNKKKGSKLITYEHGPLRKVTYAEGRALVESFARGIKKFTNLKKGDKIGLYLNTCIEWTISSFGCFLNSYIVATCYANLGKDSLVKVINECELEVLILHVDQLGFAEKTLSKKCPTLKKLILVGSTKFESKMFETKRFFDVVCDGEVQGEEEKFDLPVKDDFALFMYTSGTTGDPKGFANPRTLLKKPGGAMYKGDLELIKPKMMLGVPRVWDTIKKAIFLKVENSPLLKKVLFNSAYSRRLKYLKQGKNIDVFLSDTIFKSIASLFGGKMKLLFSAGAPLSANTQCFLHVVMGPKVNVGQAYGLTECGASNSQSAKTNWNGINNVGQSMVHSKLKLIDCPELGYFVKNNVGEILIGGECVSKGYYKKPELTKEAFDDEGWFHTGDIGRINEDDKSLSIIDRKKNLVKLSHGEYIALENLECIYQNRYLYLKIIFFCDFVCPNGICIIPNSEKDFICVIVLVDTGFVIQWIKENYEKEPGKDLEEVIKTKKFRDAVIESFNKIGKDLNKKRWQIPVDARCFSDVWTPENNLTTASMKIRRHLIKEKYLDHINEMYGKGVEKKAVIKKEEKKECSRAAKLLKPFF